jgi:hypothetical protein
MIKRVSLLGLNSVCEPQPKDKKSKRRWFECMSDQENHGFLQDGCPFLHYIDRTEYCLNREVGDAVCT